MISFHLIYESTMEFTYTAPYTIKKWKHCLLVSKYAIMFKCLTVNSTCNSAKRVFTTYGHLITGSSIWLGNAKIMDISSFNLSRLSITLWHLSYTRGWRVHFKVNWTLCFNSISFVFCYIRIWSVGQDSSDGIATCYGLDGPGIKSRWGWDFSHTSRPAPGPTQSPVHWVPGLSQG
jgi:hypothetical protein